MCVCIGVCVKGEKECKRQCVSITRWVGEINACVRMTTCVSVCERVPVSVCGCRQTLAGSWPCHSVSHTLSDVVRGCGFHYGGG